jgi:hypothetical protein
MEGIPRHLEEHPPVGLAPLLDPFANHDQPPRLEPLEGLISRLGHLRLQKP